MMKNGLDLFIFALVRKCSVRVEGNQTRTSPISPLLFYRLIRLIKVLLENVLIYL